MTDFLTYDERIDELQNRIDLLKKARDAEPKHRAPETRRCPIKWEHAAHVWAPFISTDEKIKAAPLKLQPVRYVCEGKPLTPAEAMQNDVNKLVENVKEMGALHKDGKYEEPRRVHVKFDKAGRAAKAYGATDEQAAEADRLWNEETQHLGKNPEDPRVSILDEAKGYVTKDRNKTHGEPEDNFQNIADYWQVWLRQRGWTSTVRGLTAFDVAEMMSLMKKARKAHNPTHRDSHADDIGYSACSWRTIEKGGH